MKSSRNVFALNSPLTYTVLTFVHNLLVDFIHEISLVTKQDILTSISSWVFTNTDLLKTQSKYTIVEGIDYSFKIGKV